MVEKIFRIMSNSQEYLKADILAEALLKQITLGSANPNIVFAVKEVEEGSDCPEE